MMKLIGAAFMSVISKMCLVPFSDTRKNKALHRIAWKTPMGRALLRILFSYTPHYVLVHGGETALFGGMWRTETLVNWSKSLGERGLLLVAEANRQNATILEIEATRRKLNNVRIINKALYSHDCEMQLQTSSISARNKLMHIDTYSPRNPDSNYEELVDVSAVSVDNLIEIYNINKLNHLHLTVSGSELEVLHGAERTLDKGETRVFARSILLRKDDNKPNYHSVEQYLIERYMHTIESLKESRRDYGCNIYAVPKACL